MRNAIFPPGHPGVDAFIGKLSRTLPAPEDLPRISHRNCAVVGNGTAILKQEYGKEIDAHDMVLRMNQIHVDQFAPCTGSRTTIHFLNESKSNKLIHGTFEVSSESIVIFSGPTNEYHAYGPYSEYLQNPGSTQAFVLRPSLRLAIYKYHTYAPSMGYVAVFFARLLSPEVDLYGFNVDGDRTRIARDDLHGSVHHESKFEYRLYRQWCNERFRIHW